MKQNFYSVGSFIIFFISFVAYILAFFMNFPFPNALSILFLWFFPIIGIIFGFIGKKGFFKISGLIGNIVIFIIVVVIPFVTSFFWNQP